MAEFEDPDEVELGEVIDHPPPTDPLKSTNEDSGYQSGDDDDKDATKNSGYGALSDEASVPRVDEEAMEGFIGNICDLSVTVEWMKSKYSWMYANSIMFWLRNNGRLTDQVFAPIIQQGDWAKVKYALDLILPRPAVLDFMIDPSQSIVLQDADASEDVIKLSVSPSSADAKSRVEPPLEIFALVFDAVCRGEMVCPYASTESDPVVRRDSEHGPRWEGLDPAETYAEWTSADEIYDQASNECLTMHLNSLLKLNEGPRKDPVLKEKCAIILRNSKAKEYDSLLKRLFP